MSGERVRGELASVHHAYVDARGWALGASTRRLRFAIRRLRRHTSDQTTMARRKALCDVLSDRGELVDR